LKKRNLLITGVLVALSFVAGTLSAGAGQVALASITKVFVTNFPSNQNVTVSNFPRAPSPTSHNASIDLDVINIIPGASCCSGTQGVQVLDNGSTRTNLTAAFSFGPSGLAQVTSIHVTVIYAYINSNAGDLFVARLNGQPATIPIIQSSTGAILTVVGTLQIQALHVGFNLIDVGVQRASTASYSQNYLYELRLTVEYTFLA
jgi:hypothetical protein